MARQDVKDITAKLEQGVKDIFTSDKYTEYLNFMGKFTNYSFNNCMLIMMQMPQASLVAGYKAWQTKFKRQVRKGEHGITILAPCKYSKQIEDDNGEVTVKSWTGFKTTTVFDISQTDGEEIPTITNKLTGDVKDFDELFKRLTDLSPVPVEYEDIENGANGYYSNADKRIALANGMSEQQTIKTLVHEISHAILHNNEDGEEKEADRMTREVQAESVAYTVCNALGLDTSDYSFGYIAGWSSGKEAKELSKSMEIIRKTAADLLIGWRRRKEKTMYLYGMRLRGFSIGCQPMDGLIERYDDNSGKYHDVLAYDKPLTEDEITAYELDFIGQEDN